MRLRKLSQQPPESRVNQGVTGILLRFQIQRLPVLQLERMRRWEKSWGACMLWGPEESLTWGTRHRCGRAGRCQCTITLLPQQWRHRQLFRSLVRVILFPQNDGQPYSCFSLLNPRNWGPHSFPRAIATNHHQFDLTQQFLLSVLEARSLISRCQEGNWRCLESPFIFWRRMRPGLF